MEEQIKKFLKSLRVNESLISTALGVAVILVVGGLLYSYFSKKPTTNPDDVQITLNDDSATPVKPGDVNEGETPKGLPTTHKVEKSETLWSIGERYYGSGYNFSDIVSENKLKSADDIEVGMELMIPNAPAKKQTIVEEAESVSPTPQPVAAQETISGDSYITGENDTLWTIAIRAYGDGYQWGKIYSANKTNIGRNSNKLEKGLEIVIPR